MFTQRKARLTALIVTVAALALVATVGAAKTPITMWFPASPPGVSDWVAEFEASFNAANPDIELSIDIMPLAEIREKLPIAAATGVAPDIQYEAANVMMRWIEEGLARPLDPYLERMDDLDDLIPDVLDLSEAGGKRYALPYALWPIFEMYNLDLFDLAGVKAPQTWDDRLEIARKLTRIGGNGEVEVFGYVKSLNAIAAYIQQHLAMEQLGQMPIEPGASQGALNTEAGRRAMQYLADLIHSGTNGTYAGFSWPNFNAGRIAMTEVSGTQADSFVQAADAGINLGFSRFVGPEPGTDLVQHNAANLFMVSTTKYPDEAWRVMEAFIAADNLKTFLLVDGRYSPVRQSLFIDADLMERPINRAQVELLTPPLTAYGSKHSLFPEFREPVGQFLLRGVRGEMPPELALEEADRVLNLEVRDYRPRY